jgi:endonuclease G
MPLRFEPWSGKGAVARATLYFLTHYPGDQHEHPAREGPARRAARLAHTPTHDWERHRNAAIHRARGNRNPLIDYPE